MTLKNKSPFGEIPPEIEIVRIVVIHGGEAIFDSFKFPISDFEYPVQPKSICIGETIKIFKQAFIVKDVRVKIVNNEDGSEEIKNLLIEVLV